MHRFSASIAFHIKTNLITVSRSGIVIDWAMRLPINAIDSSYFAYYVRSVESPQELRIKLNEKETVTLKCER